jgi:integrase
MPSINTVQARERLKPQHEPYWVKVTSGHYLGYRKLTTGSVGTWIARRRDPETGKQLKRSLGDFESLPAAQRFDAAKLAADDWFRHLGKGGLSESLTVQQAGEQYVEHLRTTKGEQPAKDVAARLARWVLPHAALAGCDVVKLTRHRLEAWRRQLEQQPIRLGPGRTKGAGSARSPSSLNRDMTALRAVLNWALDAGYATNDSAWRVALRPIAGADGRRTTYLDIDQRRRLIAAAEPDLAAYLRGLSLLPLRPGALASLTVANFDRRQGVLTVGTDKAGENRRIKLPDSTAEFIADASRDKLPAAPIFARGDGRQWDKDAWKLPIKAAAATAGLPPETTAYSLRHSVITDLITGGLDSLTVARLSGTSVAMIDRHYGHLRDQHAARALEQLSL